MFVHIHMDVELEDSVAQALYGAIIACLEDCGVTNDFVDAQLRENKTFTASDKSTIIQLATVASATRDLSGPPEPEPVIAPEPKLISLGGE